MQGSFCLCFVFSFSPWIYPPTTFWHSKFLMRNLLIIFLRISCMWCHFSCCFQKPPLFFIFDSYMSQYGYFLLNLVWVPWPFWMFIFTFFIKFGKFVFISSNILSASFSLLLIVFHSMCVVLHGIPATTCLHFCNLFFFVLSFLCSSLILPFLLIYHFLNLVHDF